MTGVVDSTGAVCRLEIHVYLDISVPSISGLPYTQYNTCRIRRWYKQKRRFGRKYGVFETACQSLPPPRLTNDTPHLIATYPHIPEATKTDLGMPIGARQGFQGSNVQAFKLKVQAPKTLGTPPGGKHGHISGRDASSLKKLKL